MPMTIDELREWVKPETKEDLTWQKAFVRTVNQAFPDAFEQVEKEALADGLRPVLHQFERRLARPLTEDEHHTIVTRLSTVGPNRLGDVIFDLSPEELADWLSDPEVT